MLRRCKGLAEKRPSAICKRGTYPVRKMGSPTTLTIGGEWSQGKCFLLSGDVRSERSDGPRSPGGVNFRSSIPKADEYVLLRCLYLGGREGSEREGGRSRKIVAEMLKRAHLGTGRDSRPGWSECQKKRPRNGAGL